jgi:KaiC
VTPPAVVNAPRSVASTGVAGLDDILAGGLPRRRLYLIEGVPGSGKTTLALQFLLEGAKNGESVLYVTLSETAEGLRAVAESHGWQLDENHMFLFDESPDTLRTRCQHLNVPGHRTNFDPTDRPRRAHPARVHTRHSDGCRRTGREDHRDRQLERVSERDAGGTAFDDSAARGPGVLRPEGRRHHPHRSTAGSHRQPVEHPGGGELSG